MKAMNWTSAADHLNKQGKAYVMVTLVSVSGSTPRNNGSKMIITADAMFDTIGGGHLEHQAMKHAHQLLKNEKACQKLEHFQLGSRLGQCCGGTAILLFEYFESTVANIMVFGAGHVGKALISILSSLPCQIKWVDCREEQFPSISYNNVETIVSENVEDEINHMPKRSFYVVMTHNHQMDFDICQKILKQADFEYLGLIASQTKWRRFQHRFNHREIAQGQVNRMNCPIGLADVPGKLPMEIAVSVAGELINRYQAIAIKDKAKNNQASTELSNDTLPSNKQNRTNTHQGIHWQELTHLIEVKE